MYLLDNYTLSADMRYEAHTLIYSPPGEIELQFHGVLAAAMFSALIMHTPEGERRELSMEEEGDFERWVKRYEDEMMRDDGGVFETEIQWLHEAYMELDFDIVPMIQKICGSQRLMERAYGYAMAYMMRLSEEYVAPHIYDQLPFYQPFAEWLYDAAFIETRRQTILQTTWYDPKSVYYLTTLYSPTADYHADETPKPTFVFEGLASQDLMQRYFDWIWSDAQQQAAQQPNSKAVLVTYKRAIFDIETDPKVLQSHLDSLSPNDKHAYRQWWEKWVEFITRALKNPREIRFWTDEVPDDVRKQLLYRLKQQEQLPRKCFHALTLSIYAMRQMGFIRRKCTDKDMRQWLSEHLTKDYTNRNIASSFRRAMNEHSRYSLEVEVEKEYLEKIGYHLPKRLPDNYDPIMDGPPSLHQAPVL